MTAIVPSSHRHCTSNVESAALVALVSFNINPIHCNSCLNAPPTNTCTGASCYDVFFCWPCPACVTILPTCVTLLPTCVTLLPTCVILLPTYVTLLPTCVTLLSTSVTLLPACVTLLPACLTLMSTSVTFLPTSCCPTQSMHSHRKTANLIFISFTSPTLAFKYILNEWYTGWSSWRRPGEMDGGAGYDPVRRYNDPLLAHSTHDRQQFVSLFYGYLFHSSTATCSTLLRLSVPLFYGYLFHSSTATCSTLLRLPVSLFYCYLFHSSTATCSTLLRLPVPLR